MKFTIFFLIFKERKENVFLQKMLVLRSSPLQYSSINVEIRRFVFIDIPNSSRAPTSSSPFPFFYVFLRFYILFSVFCVQFCFPADLTEIRDFQQ